MRFEKVCLISLLMKLKHSINVTIFYQSRKLMKIFQIYFLNHMKKQPEESF